MNKILFVIFTLFVSTLFAQQETLLRAGEITHGGYGGPVVKFNNIKGEFGLLVGGRGAWVINHSFGLGAGGYGLTNNIKTDIMINGKQRRIQFGYGGVFLEYVMNSHRMVHFTLSTLIGGGVVTLSDGDYLDNEGSFDNTSPFFALEPEAGIELNITTFFRINAGVSYLYINGVDKFNLTGDDFSGPSAYLIFKFGKF